MKASETKTKHSIAKTGKNLLRGRKIVYLSMLRALVTKLLSKMF